jgi:hypothetical protein
MTTTLATWRRRAIAAEERAFAAERSHFRRAPIQLRLGKSS